MIETDNRYWIEEIKSDWTPFIDKSDVLDYDKILYILHDNQAFEDYPVAMSPNLNLLVGLCDRLNEYEIDVQQLKKENNKIKTLLFQKIKELDDSYQKGAKAGMPTGGIIGELDSFEEICEEMGWEND